jgi:hypothetical protein
MNIFKNGGWTGGYLPKFFVYQSKNMTNSKELLTDRDCSGSKMHLHVVQNTIRLGVVMVGANVHDSRLVSTTIDANIISLVPSDPKKSTKHIFR